MGKFTSAFGYGAPVPGGLGGTPVHPSLGMMSMANNNNAPYLYSHNGGDPHTVTGAAFNYANAPAHMASVTSTPGNGNFDWNSYEAKEVRNGGVPNWIQNSSAPADMSGGVSPGRVPSLADIQAESQRRTAMRGF